MGHEVSSIKPYIINAAHPKEFIMRSLVIFLIRKEIISISDAIYPIKSVRVIPIASIVRQKNLKSPETIEVYKFN